MLCTFCRMLIAYILIWSTLVLLNTFQHGRQLPMSFITYKFVSYKYSKLFIEMHNTVRVMVIVQSFQTL